VAPIRRTHRVAGEQVLDVRENEFLVLLFVIEPEREQPVEVRCLPGRLARPVIAAAMASSTLAR
jgi:hypothetical protein